MKRDKLIQHILNVRNEDFDAIALDLYRYQFQENAIYRRFCELIDRTPATVGSSATIPHLPIAFFKSHGVMSGDFVAETTFLSSTTTGHKPSRHFVRDISLYQIIAQSCFEYCFNQNPLDYTWFGLLPSYLDRPGSSLVHMVKTFMGEEAGGFFLDDYRALEEALREAMAAGRPVILIGVAFALLDFAKYTSLTLDDVLVIETGGMKGRGRELTRTELHRQLCDGLGVSRIYSEYGMTELFSQAWTAGGNRFLPGPTLRVTVRELSDPLALAGSGVRGGINCTDLGNVDSCAFIATDDAGVVYADGRFEVIGRLDGSEMRGCNLMFTG